MIRKCVNSAAGKPYGTLFFFSFPAARVAGYITCYDCKSHMLAASHDGRQVSTARPSKVVPKKKKGRPPGVVEGRLLAGRRFFSEQPSAEHNSLSPELRRHLPWMSSINTEAHLRRPWSELIPPLFYFPPRRPASTTVLPKKPEERSLRHASVSTPASQPSASAGSCARSGARAPVASVADQTNF